MDSIIKEPFRIVLIGHTGAGKTSTGNLLLGKRILDDSHNRNDEAVDRFDCKLKVFETPGLQNPDKEQLRIYKEITETILLTEPGPHAILMISRIGRFTDEQRKTVEELIQTFGESVFKYMVVVLTFKDNLFSPDTETEMEVSTYIRESPSELKDLIHRCDNRCVAINNRSRNDRDKQAYELWKVVSDMITANGGSIYTHERMQQIYNFKDDRSARETTAGKGRESAKSMVHQHYTPSESFASISGDENIEKRLEKLEQTVGKIENTVNIVSDYVKKKNACNIL